MDEGKVFLKYVGAGSFLFDVPARDLTREEAEYHGIGRLLDSHLYERVTQEPKVDAGLPSRQDEIDLEIEKQKQLRKVKLRGDK